MTNVTGRTKQVFKLKGKSTSSKKVAILSDYHTGSRFAVTSRDGPDKPTRHQIVLREHWLESSDKVGKHIDLLVQNGEPVNGVNRRNNGAENYTSSIPDQVTHAVDATMEWRFDAIVVTRGSGYHSRDGWTWYEEFFAKEIGAIKNGENGNYTDFHTAFRFNEKVFNATHYIRGSIWPAYLTTPLTREGMGVSLNRTKYYDDSVKHVDVIIRSHMHHRHMTDVGRSLLCLTPGWQFPNEYTAQSGMGTVYPTLGCIWFDIEQNGDIAYYKHDLPDWKIPKKKLLEF